MAVLTQSLSATLGLISRDFKDGQTQKCLLSDRRNPKHGKRNGVTYTIPLDIKEAFQEIPLFTSHEYPTVFRNVSYHVVKVTGGSSVKAEILK